MYFRFHFFKRTFQSWLGNILSTWEEQKCENHRYGHRQKSGYSPQPCSRSTEAGRMERPLRKAHQTVLWSAPFCFRLALLITFQRIQAWRRRGRGNLQILNGRAVDFFVRSTKSFVELKMTFISRNLRGKHGSEQMVTEVVQGARGYSPWCMQMRWPLSTEKGVSPEHHWI